MTNISGKKLLILGANYETISLINAAHDLGVKTVALSSIKEDPAKKVSDISYDIDGLDVAGIIDVAEKEHVDGILVGVADVLVPSYYRVCNALSFPCYANNDIVNIFSYKDRFKSCCEQYGIHGVPEFFLDEELRRTDLDRLEYPVVIKPVDSRSGIGITVCYEEQEIENAVKLALEHSKCKRFIAEKYMDCDDLGLYYTFKDGKCSASCIYDRYTTNKQIGKSRVCLGGTYPSKHIDKYFSRVHNNLCRMFKDIGIRDGVLMLSAFYNDGEFYVYDTGFRLQGEAPNILIKAINGFDQRELLIRFALTGNGGNLSLNDIDDPYLGGKWAATLWIILKDGYISEIHGLDELDNDNRVIANKQRLFVGDTVLKDWIGTEKQVLSRLYFVCNDKISLANALKEYMDKISVKDENGKEMIVEMYNVDHALEI